MWEVHSRTHERQCIGADLELHLRKVESMQRCWVGLAHQSLILESGGELRVLSHWSNLELTSRLLSEPSVQG